MPERQFTRLGEPEVSLPLPQFFVVGCPRGRKIACQRLPQAKNHGVNRTDLPLGFELPEGDQGNERERNAQRSPFGQCRPAGETADSGA